MAPMSRLNEQGLDTWEDSLCNQESKSNQLTTLVNFIDRTGLLSEE